MFQELCRGEGIIEADDGSGMLNFEMPVGHIPRKVQEVDRWWSDLKIQ